MQLVIPEGAQVHITVGHPPQLSLSGATAMPSAGRVLKGFLAAVVIFGAFQIGRFIPHHPDAVPFARAADTGQAQTVRPVRPTDGVQPDPSQIPPAFRQELARPPQMEPAPGHVAVSPNAPAPANPFGLHE